MYWASVEVDRNFCFECNNYPYSRVVPNNHMFYVHYSKPAPLWFLTTWGMHACVFISCIITQWFSEYLQCGVYTYFIHENFCLIIGVRQVPKSKKKHIFIYNMLEFACCWQGPVLGCLCCDIFCPCIPLILGQWMKCNHWAKFQLLKYVYSLAFTDTKMRTIQVHPMSLLQPQYRIDCSGGIIYAWIVLVFLMLIKKTDTYILHNHNSTPIRFLYPAPLLKFVQKKKDSDWQTSLFTKASILNHMNLNHGTCSPLWQPNT